MNIDTETGEILSPATERLVAFHELVTVKAWTDSSSRGPTIKVGLGSRDSLTIFETVTRRAKKRAGQRFAAIWQDEALSRKYTMDLWFAGANWAHQDGASVKFSILSDDLETFQQDWKLPLANNDGHPIFYWLTLVQIDDDEKPIDQKKAELMDATEPKPKGGPKSKRVAILTQQPDFQQYVYFRKREPAGPDPMGDADRWVKETCNVTSKVEFDHNEAAWDLFQTRVMSPFVRWGESQQWREDDDGEGAEGDS